MKNEIKTMLLCAAALSLTAFADKPDKWVRYVESTGSSWVDTGIIGRWNTKIECQVEWMTIADSAFVASRSGDNRIYMCYCLNDKGEITLSQGGNATVTLKSGWNTRFEKNRIYNFTAELSATNGTGQSTGSVAIDGVGGWSKAVAGVDSGLNLYIFANNRGGGTVAGQSKSRCYGLKIWQGPKDGGPMVLVRDFRPCMKGGRAALYDAQNDQIYYAGSSTDIVCDENSEWPDEFIEYVESQGVAAEKNGQQPAYIDTGIVGKAGTVVEFKETSLERDSAEHCVIGSRDATNRFFIWFHATGYLAGLGYGGTYWRPVTNDPTKAGAWGDPNLYPLNYGDTTHAWVSFEEGSQTFKTIDDATGAEKVWSSLSIAGDVNTGKNLYVFARNNNGTVDAFSRSRLYFLKIWQGNKLVRDFRPCLKNGVAGLYDDVEKRIFYSLATPLVYNNVYRESVKPKEVVFVEYIESDGNNTLDTGVPARSGLRARGEMAWMQAGDDANGNPGKSENMRTWQHEVNRYLENIYKPNVFDRQWRAYLAAESLIKTNRFFMVHEVEGALNFAYNKSGNVYIKNGNSNIKPYVGTNYTFDVTFEDGVQKFEWDGVEVLNTNIASTVETDDTLHLFSSSYWRNRAAARCYGLQIWEGNTLVRDFKPCICEVTNNVFKGMLYDTVSKSIYRPSPDIPASRVGNIVFSGEEKPACYVEYVETDGKQFIDTGVIGKAATTAEFKETSLQKASNVEECFLGSYGTGSTPRFYMWYHAWGCTAGIGYGEYWRPKNNDPYTVATDSADPDVYKLNAGDTTHARVSFANGLQTFYTIDDATGAEKLWSTRSLTGNVDTTRAMYLFAKNDSDSGKPASPAASRFYYLKIWQGNSDGTGMQIMRDFRPVRLTNGLVVLWDFANNEPYLPKSTTAPYNYTTFPVVGTDGERIYTRTRIIVR